MTRNCSRKHDTIPEIKKDKNSKGTRMISREPSRVALENRVNEGVKITLTFSLDISVDSYDKKGKVKCINPTPLQWHFHFDLKSKINTNHELIYHFIKPETKVILSFTEIKWTFQVAPKYAKVLKSQFFITCCVSNTFLSIVLIICHHRTSWINNYFLITISTILFTVT